MDLFKGKLAHSPLSICFPQFDGTNTYEVALPYIQDKFLSQISNKSKLKRGVFSHTTCATDTENIRTVFDIVTDVIITKSWEGVGLL